MARALHLALLSLVCSLVQESPAAIAEPPQSWLTRCARDIGRSNDAETATYMFQSMGKAEGAPARAEMDYTAKGSGGQIVYLTDAKDLMNPYGGASLSIGYYGAVGAKAPFPVEPKVGHVSLSAIAKDFKPIAGTVRLKLVIDGKVFGPYEPKSSSLDNGQYSVWLDTADTDGDSKPPILKPAQFAALAKAVDAIKAADVIIARDGIDIVRMPTPLQKFAELRAALPKWASETGPKVSAVAMCLAGDRSVN